MIRQTAPIVAIVGRANVGKSSLFNSLIGYREAITASEAGTTRDPVIAKATHKGKDFWLTDTAGLKPADDEFELSIQEQIIDAINAAHTIVVVVESDIPPSVEDRQTAKKALKSRKPVVLVVNKIDRNRKASLDQWLSLGIKKVLATSTTQKTGLEELMDEIAEQIPQGHIKEDRNSIRLAILGRPNVGKSSLFNSMAKKQQALVSSKAGTTRDVNRLALKYHDQKIEIMDTAGIRRSGKIEPGVEKFSVLRALAAIEEADICLVVIDINEASVQLDQKIAGMVSEAGKGLILVVSKLDAAEDQKETVVNKISRDFIFVQWAPLILTSSVSGQNITKIFELASQIKESRHAKIKTTDLNKWLGEATATHVPAGLKSSRPQLNYITQEDDQDFPNFKIFGGDSRLLHWSYKRYLEHSFREKWPLLGTPIKFWFIDKK